jgi:hypothetical protein
VKDYLLTQPTYVKAKTLL